MVIEANMAPVPIFGERNRNFLCIFFIFSPHQFFEKGKGTFYFLRKEQMRSSSVNQSLELPPRVARKLIIKIRRILLEISSDFIQEPQLR